MEKEELYTELEVLQLIEHIKMNRYMFEDKSPIELLEKYKIDFFKEKNNTYKYTKQDIINFKREICELKENKTKILTKINMFREMLDNITEI